MNASHLTIRLSSKELFYLKNTAFLDDRLMMIINAAENAETGLHLLHPKANIRDQFGSAFTERLGRVGFDREYKLTREGELLEQLIDKFGPIEN